MQWKICCQQGYVGDMQMVWYYGLLIIKLKVVRLHLQHGKWRRHGFLLDSQLCRTKYSYEFSPVLYNKESFEYLKTMYLESNFTNQCLECPFEVPLRKINRFRNFMMRWLTIGIYWPPGTIRFATTREWYQSSGETTCIVSRGHPRSTWAYLKSNSTSVSFTNSEWSSSYKET